MLPAPRALAAAEVDARLTELVALLTDAVESGASVGFVLPLAAGEAEAFWRDVALDLADGLRTALVAEVDGHIAGTVLLAPCLKPNQPHRADVQKLLVHRRYRGQGLGRLLMAGVEATARAAGRTLLTLDTRSGSAAEALYRTLGWREVGVIAGYALDPDRTLAACTFFCKHLEASS